MKQLLFLTFLTLGISLVQAQTQPTKPMAPLKIVVTNFEGVPQPGELVIFVSQSTNKSYSGTSNAKGEFKITLPGEDTYEIKVKSLGAAKQTSSLKLPALPKGSQYAESTVTIQYEMSQVQDLDIQFETGKSALEKGSHTALDELVDLLNRKPKLKIEIAGHTDNVGEDDANMKLSQARADVVKKYLISKGIPSSRIIAKGYGENDPIADNGTAEGRQLNRRTEVRVVK